MRFFSMATPAKALTLGAALALFTTGADARTYSPEQEIITSSFNFNLIGGGNYLIEAGMFVRDIGVYGFEEPSGVFTARLLNGQDYYDFSFLPDGRVTPIKWRSTRQLNGVLDPLYFTNQILYDPQNVKFAGWHIRFDDGIITSGSGTIAFNNTSHVLQFYDPVVLPLPAPALMLGAALVGLVRMRRTAAP